MTSIKTPLSAPEARARFVVTLPMRPCFLESALAQVSPEGAPALTATQDAFTHLSRRSKNRLVLITPFIDAAGLAWATELFQVTAAKQRILILRDVSRLSELGKAGQDLANLTTELLEYRVKHLDGDRKYPIETFHAKIALADGSAAYVGSANLLHSSIELALECGFIIEGPAVSQVTDLVEAMLLVAREHS